MSRETFVAVAIAVVMLIAGGFAIYVSQINTLPDSSFALFDEVPAPTVSDTVLVVTPHQDDETIGAGGYITRAVNVGATVKVIVATDGNKHGLEKERNQEELNASAVLGVKPANITFYGYPDGDLSGNQTAFDARLQADIAALHPTVVITTLPEDTHPDHAAAGNAVIAAYHALNQSFTPEFFLVHYHRYPRPIGYDPTAHLLPPIDLLTPTYDWRVLSLTSSEQATKAAAINNYKTQLTITNPVLTQLIRSFERQNELFATIKN